MRVRRLLRGWGVHTRRCARNRRILDARLDRRDAQYTYGALYEWRLVTVSARQAVTESSLRTEEATRCVVRQTYMWHATHCTALIGTRSLQA